ncbi:hypothetical protein [Paenibacillus sp. KN14-4R]|uniref:hypothetical protein n=1 Tax=Paenibacillus sp. KN14-4R TaxID=3445773 RepID=UPI003FA15E0E
METLQHELKMLEGLCGDIHRDIRFRRYDEAKFKARVSEMTSIIKRWQTDDRSNIRFIGIKMAETLTSIIKLATVTQDGRKWNRLRAKIEHNSDLIGKLAKEVKVDGV